MCRNLANDIMLRTWKIMDQGSRIQDLMVVSENALDFKNESLQRLLWGLWNRSRRVLGKTLLDEKTTNEKNKKRSEKEDEKGKSKTPWRPTWIFAEMLSNFACLIGKAIYLTCHACKKSWNYAWKKKWSRLRPCRQRATSSPAWCRAPRGSTRASRRPPTTSVPLERFTFWVVNV